MGFNVNVNLFGLPILASNSRGYYVTSNRIISINDRAWHFLQSIYCVMRLEGINWIIGTE